MRRHRKDKPGRTLSEKAALANILSTNWNQSFDPDAEQLWVDEAQRRYDAYQKGELQAFPGDEVMARARNRIN